MWPSVAKDNQSGQSGVRLCQGHRWGTDPLECGLTDGRESLESRSFNDPQGNSTQRAALHHL